MALLGYDMDLAAHTQMLRAAQDPRARCEVTGYSLLALRKVGDKLSVDRINSRRGYTPDNMRLIALSLNVAKGVQAEVPVAAVNRLIRRMARCVEDRWTQRRVTLPI